MTRFTRVVPAEANGARLDRFLATSVAGTSRAELQRWIEHGRVTIDGRARKAADRVTVGSVSVVEPEEPARTAALP